MEEIEHLDKRKKKKKNEEGLFLILFDDGMDAVIREYPCFNFFLFSKLSFY